MAIGVMVSVGHHGKGYGAGVPTLKPVDSGCFLFDQDFFGRWGWLLLSCLAEFFLSLLFPFGKYLRSRTKRFFDFLLHRCALHPIDVRLLEQGQRIGIDIHVTADWDKDINTVFPHLRFSS